MWTKYFLPAGKSFPSLFPVSGFGQTRSACYRTCQKNNVFIIDIFINAFQKFPVSILGDRNPLLSSTTGIEQTSVLTIYSWLYQLILSLTSLLTGLTTLWRFIFQQCKSGKQCVPHILSAWSGGDVDRTCLEKCSEEFGNFGHRAEFSSSYSMTLWANLIGNV